MTIKTNVSLKQVLQQLKDDLIGKDSYRGVTFTYSWLANQFGHFGLGFFTTLLLSKWTWFMNLVHIHNPLYVSAWIVWGGWITFELFNFLGPLLKKAPSRRYLTTKDDYIFQPAWFNIAFDTATDLCYFGLGCFSCTFWLQHQHRIMVDVILIVVAYPSVYWYLTKLYLQAAEYPFQFRLSQWQRHKISTTDVNTINTYLKNKDKIGKHLLIFGGAGSGKTPLGVAIGTEFAIKHTRTFYTTGVKLLDMFYMDDNSLKQDVKSYWSWREAGILVIDDLNPGEPITNECITPQLFWDSLTASPYSDENLRALKKHSVIWILGNQNKSADFQSDWYDLLEKKLRVVDISCIDSLGSRHKKTIQHHKEL